MAYLCWRLSPMYVLRMQDGICCKAQKQHYHTRASRSRQKNTTHESNSNYVTICRAPCHIITSHVKYFPTLRPVENEVCRAAAAEFDAQSRSRLERIVRLAFVRRGLQQRSNRFKHMHNLTYSWSRLSRRNLTAEGGECEKKGCKKHTYIIRMWCRRSSRGTSRDLHQSDQISHAILRDRNKMHLRHVTHVSTSTFE